MFRASGHTVAFPGFTAVYVEEGTDDEKRQQGRGKALPPFAEGDTLTAKKIDPSQHFTQPPARYTEASLIRAMEERGIGRPSTHAPTISTILDRDYVSQGRTRRYALRRWARATGLLVDKFKSVADYEFTAKMEEQLDEVEAGKARTISSSCTISMTTLKKALGRPRSIWRANASRSRTRSRDVIWHKCGRNMVKSGRFRQFPGLPGYPECTNTKPITEDKWRGLPGAGPRWSRRSPARGYVYYSCENTRVPVHHLG